MQPFTICVAQTKVNLTIVTATITGDCILFLIMSRKVYLSIIKYLFNPNPDLFLNLTKTLFPP